MNDHYDIKEVTLVIATLLVAMVIGSGCASRSSIEWESVPQQPFANTYKYYVIDTNSDIPDAHFTTYEEAAVYQKEFAEHHEYVIVKTEGKYNVYNMEPIENDIRTVQKSE